MVMMISTLSTAMTHHKTAGPLYHHFLSDDFGLGQVNGKLVAVGGEKKSDFRATNEVYTYDERSRKWKQTIPPMPTARYSTGVLSLQSALVVAGGVHLRWRIHRCSRDLQSRHITVVQDRPTTNSLSRHITSRYR